MGQQLTKPFGDQPPSQKNKRCIVTGANNGIGYHTAFDIGCRGADVILACRNDERGQKAAAEMLSKCTEKAKAEGLSKCAGSFEFMKLDTSDLSSVRSFADAINKQDKAVDILVNNAGIMMNPTRELSPDGFEMQLATNYLGHFALTGLLLPSLRKSENARIVNVSSLLAWVGNWKVLPVDFKRNKNYDPEGVYADSKLANLLFSHELAKKVPDMVVTSAHPGGVKTALQKHAYNDYFSQTFILGAAENGARPSIRAALDPSAKSGDYFGPILGCWGGLPMHAIKPFQADDDELAHLLWQAAAAATGIKY